MNYLTYSKQEHSNYPVCFLVQQIKRDEITKAYIEPYGLDPEEILAIDLHYSNEKKKTPVSEIKEYIELELQEVFNDCNVQYILVSDAEYFKVLTKTTKADLHLGYVMDSVYGSQKVIYIPSFKAIFYDPEKITAKIAQGINALIAHRSVTYQDPGKNIIKFAAYPQSVDDIFNWLKKILEMDCDLTNDIEGFSLKHYTCGIGTITLCWNQHEGIAFPVDLGPNPKEVRELLVEFFTLFKRKMIYHNIGFDVTVLIYQLFMKSIIDTEGLLRGMDIMLRNWDDTKLIAYLATNSCAGNKLGLKDQSQEYAGNYAQEDIKDITKIPLPELLQYNLIDGLATWYVHTKWYQKMIDDNQLDVYENVFKPAMVDIIQMQLTGMPMDMKAVKKVKHILQQISDDSVNRIMQNPLVQQFIYQMNEDLVAKKNATYKKKRITIADVNEVLNPNSPLQLQKLLYNQIGLPVIELTDSKQPSTGGDVLKALKNHTEDPVVQNLLDGLIDYMAVKIILTTFIPAFEEAQLGPDGHYYLFGNFNLGGTVSGRLSSSGPNLQNLPANAKMLFRESLKAIFGDTLDDYIIKGDLMLGKLIKTCFKAPDGWMFCGLDFASLEDRISALTTKDPMKLKVYTDGYDGHSLRAYAYFSEDMPDIDPNDVDSINSIQKKYPVQRYDSKAPTFALTYQGTYVTLIKNCGFTEQLAKQIEERYHIAYAVSDQWVENKLEQASKDGYVTVAFGLRVRTPLLHQVIRGTSKTPYAASAEGRTAGNALGQSWCLLNSRASSEFMGKVRTSQYRLDIRPCAQIHDASYYMIREDMGALLYTNEHLVQAVKWQDHPDIWHDEVKLGGDVSIFYPDWSKEIVIPNGATAQVIEEKIQEHMEKL